ncbi:MAG: DUF3179 domain-containing protein [Actinobacteria bacterium]|nr:DUF3179 domain-containing protein [Actinomycetota bacterium]
MSAPPPTHTARKPVTVGQVPDGSWVVCPSRRPVQSASRRRRSWHLVRRLVAFVVAAALLVGCASSEEGSVAGRGAGGAESSGSSQSSPVTTARTFPPPPAGVPSGSLTAEAIAAIDALLVDLESAILLAIDVEMTVRSAPLEVLASSGDVRLAWVLSDLLRFMQGTDGGDDVAEAAERLTGVELGSSGAWTALTDVLIAWDVPAPPGYVAFKKRAFEITDVRWSFLFDDPDAAIDYRLVSWGGVLIDDRPLGSTSPCPGGCIPSLDDPALTPASGGGWYPDDGLVFGVEIGGEAVAFPRNIMETHEMVNMTIGGRRVGIPYCTLCGSAQAFFTDTVAATVPGVARPPVLRTSGLLSRSNKIMYDLDSRSVFNTFTGAAVSGPLQDAGVVLEQVAVVTTTWAAWRKDNPHTSIIAEDGGIGRTYKVDPLGGRDAGGPIFPIGDVDPRLPVHTQVLGVILGDGTAVAFNADSARIALRAGRTVQAAGVTLRLEAEGLVATVNGRAVPSHQAFWFAWSQFHPGTALWVA